MNVGPKQSAHSSYTSQTPREGVSPRKDKGSIIKHPDKVYPYFTKMKEFEGWEVVERGSLGRKRIKNLVKRSLKKTEGCDLHAETCINQPMLALRDRMLAQMATVSSKTKVVDRANIEENEVDKIHMALWRNSQAFSPILKNINISLRYLKKAIKEEKQLTEFAKFVVKKLKKFKNIIENEDENYNILLNFTTKYHETKEHIYYGSHFKKIFLAILNPHSKQNAKNIIKELKKWEEPKGISNLVQELENLLVAVLKKNDNHYETSLTFSQFDYNWKDLTSSYWRGNQPCYMNTCINTTTLGTYFKGEKDFHKLLIAKVYTMLHKLHFVDEEVIKKERDLLITEQPCSVKDPLTLGSINVFLTCWDYFCAKTRFKEFFAHTAGNKDSMQILFKNHETDSEKYVVIVTRIINIEEYNENTKVLETVGILSLEAIITAKLRIGQNEVDINLRKKHEVKKNKTKEKLRKLREEKKRLENEIFKLQEERKKQTDGFLTDTTKVFTRTTQSTLNLESQTVEDMSSSKKSSTKSPRKRRPSVKKKSQISNMDSFDIVIHPSIQPTTTKEEILRKFALSLEPLESVKPQKEESDRQIKQYYQQVHSPRKRDFES